MNHRLEADTNMGTWRETLAASITRPEDLAKHLDVDPEAIKDVVGEYPMRITPMWMKLIKEKARSLKSVIYKGRCDLAPSDSRARRDGRRERRRSLA